MGEVSGNWANSGERPAGNAIAVDLPNVMIPKEEEFSMPVSVQGAAINGVI